MSVPPPADDETNAVANEIRAALESPQCKFCDYEPEGDDWGELLEDLARHGETEHATDDTGRWVEG